MLFVYDLLDGEFIEIGTINVPSLGGFELQKLLIVLTALRFLLVDESQRQVVFATFNPGNERQTTKLAEAFMIPWDEPPTELLEAKEATIVTGAEHPVFFRFDRRLVPNACRYLTDIVEEVLIPSRINRLSKVPESLSLVEIDHFVTRRLMSLVRDQASK